MAFVKPTFQLKISNPERVFFEGEAYSLSSQNASGPFDILPNHAHFVSLLHDAKIEVVDKEDKKVVFAVSRGLISARSNLVTVFVDL
jgi:F-type H+-transporting ATPase subunit epsilon